MNQTIDTPAVSPLTGEDVYDPIEERLRANVRAIIETMFEEELAEFLGRLRYGRGDRRAKGYRHGHRDRQLTGPSAPRPCVCRARGSRIKQARCGNGGPGRYPATSG